MIETIGQKHQWLVDHPEELTRYPDEFIAVAGGKVLAHGRDFAKVLAKARKAGHEPLMSRCFRKDLLEIL